ncbi:Hypothetical predicted protein, partial [Olea europaea subsp. europaea]
DLFEGNLEPVDTHFNRAMDERGKMVPDEAWMNGLKSGPTKTICTPSTPIDVPTDYVNLDDVVDDLVDMENAESASMRVSRAEKRQWRKQSTLVGLNV